MLRGRALCLFVFLLPLRGLAQGLPHPDHIVLVIMENKRYEDVIDDNPATPASKSRAPYLNGLAQSGALLTRSYGLHHPSQPNYIELFSGNAQGICSDHPPRALIDAPNLARSLGEAPNLGTKRGFVGFAENLPADLATPSRGEYVRRHCPWLAFSGIPADRSSDFSKFPQTADGFVTLPAVAIVIPNLFDDIHSTSGSSPVARLKRRFNRHDIVAEVLQGDSWLEHNLGAYAAWAVTNNSLLVITWDEDSAENISGTLQLELDRLDHDDRCEHAINTTQPNNHIPTIIIGEHVLPHSTSEAPITHYNLLHTILDMEGLPPLGGSKTAPPITDIWQ